jgi:hypothetical protein
VHHVGTPRPHPQEALDDDVAGHGQGRGDVRVQLEDGAGRDVDRGGLHRPGQRGRSVRHDQPPRGGGGDPVRGARGQREARRRPGDTLQEGATPHALTPVTSGGLLFRR